MFTATLYNKTGFTLLNIPDSEATLQAAATSTKAVPAMDILQLLYNDKITIRAFENDVMYADYMKLTDDDNHKSAFYVINTYTMTSGDTVELDITMEPVLTGGGIAAITSDDCIIDGMVTRHMMPIQSTMWDELRNAPVEEDPLFKPTDPTNIELAAILFETPDQNKSSKIIVLSSVDIDAANSFKYDIETSAGLETYVDANLITGDPINYVIPGKYDDEYYQTAPTGGQHISASAYTGNLTVLGAQADVVSFRKKLVKLMANNMVGIITDAYITPNKWVTPVVAPSQSPRVAGEIWAERVGIDAALPLDGDNLAIQAYIGKYNEFIFVASASGNIKEYSIKEMKLSKDGSSVKITVNGMSDPRPNGGVDFAVAEPGNDVTGAGIIEDKYSIIKGGNWYHVQMDAIGNKGAIYNLPLFNAQRASRDIAAYVNASFGIESANDTAFGTLNPMYAIKSVQDDIEKIKLGNYHGGYTGQGYDEDYVDWGSAIAGGNERMKALFDRANEKATEVAQYNQANAPQPMVVTSPSGDYDYYDHCLFVFKRSLSERDRGRFSDLVCRFGVRQTIKLQKSYLTNRRYFNYVEGTGIKVACPNNSRELNNRMSEALNGGVRIWHTKPSSTYYTGPDANPNAT